ncbi:MAG TPA: TadE family protein [Candidatus Binatia bacterium]|nr:TadE family protein [Candidatus Binatia bacterium]
MRRLASRNQRGTSTLELLAVLPTLLFVFLVGVEMSRAWLTATLVTNAVREGVRTASVAPAATAPAEGLARINEVLASANLTAAIGPTVTCNPAPCSTETDSRVEATVTVNFQTIVPIFVPMLDSVPIQQTASMRFE